LTGGYISAFDVTTGTGWHQINADASPGRAAARGRLGSRREPRDQWRMAEAEPRRP
jgi:hypothetical protein